MERILQGGMERGYGTGVWNRCGPGACSGPPILTCPHFDNIVSDISSGSVYGMCFLTFYSGILSDILFGHYFLAFYLASFLTSYLASFLASILTFLAFFLIIYLASILTFFPASLLALYHFIWHSI